MIKAYKNVRPQYPTSVYIDPTSVLYGDIAIDEESSIWPLVAARGDVNFITIGKRTNIQDGSVLHVTRKSESNPNGFPLLIGDDVTVGHKVMLHGCTIGSRILIGMGAIVMDGATVSDDVIIGAGSLVPPGKTLAPGHLYVGNPVRQIRPLTETEIAFLKISADNYVKLKDDYLAELGR